MNSLTIPFPAPRAGLSPLIVACLAATWLIWGSTYLAIRLALVSFPPFFGMGTRFLAAGMLLAAWMRWARGASWPSLAQWRNALVVGALMLGGGMGGTAYAEQTVGSGLVHRGSAGDDGVGPDAVGRLSEPGFEAGGIALGLIGVLLLTQGEGFRASTAGLVAIGIACLTWTAGSLLSQRHMPLAPGAMGFASEMICGGAVLMLLAALNHEYAGVAAHGLPQPSAVVAWIYLVVFGSLIAFNAYMLLLARTPTSLASSYCFVNPVIAMLLGVTIGGEVVTGYEWLAAAVVLTGVVLLLAGRKPAGG